MNNHSIAVLPGDGVGKEVMPAAQNVLNHVARLWDFSLEWTSFPWGCDYFREHGKMMPETGLEQLAEFDSIFLGAVGDPSVPDHVSVWGLIIPIRRGFRQHINLRPIRLLRGIKSPLSDAESAPIDIMVVRENSEGEYSEIGGRLHSGTDHEMAMQESIFTKIGVERVGRYALELARKRDGNLVSATKSNGIMHTMPFWDETIRGVASEYPDIALRFSHIDALAAHFVLRPASFDVVVASNLFGDILSDLGAAVVGSVGIAPSGNINLDGDYPSMFEPIHGSAPDIAGRGVANPIGQIWSGAMMIEHLGHSEAAGAIVSAIEDVIVEGTSTTPDLGGDASTAEAADAIVGALKGL